MEITSKQLGIVMFFILLIILTVALYLIIKYKIIGGIFGGIA